jgi:uncharacterized protein YprB with RNaseH-like and TPR domain
MLRRTFTHLPQIGSTLESKLWKRGILDWQDLAHELRTNGVSLLPSAKIDAVLQAIETSEDAFGRGDLKFFYQFLPKSDRWRMVPGFEHRAAYLDIETTGSGMPPLSHSTVICFYYQGTVFQEVEPAKKRALVEAVTADCSFLVTYFGEGFDVPFLRREMTLEIDSAHVDLCFWLRKLGFKGGLKKVQKLFAEIPARTSMDLDGLDAVRLWQMHRRGIKGALETLCTYNAEDTVVLDPLLRLAFNLQIEKSALLDQTPLPLLEPPRLGLEINPEIYSLLKDPDSSLPDAFHMA